MGRDRFGGSLRSTYERGSTMNTSEKIVAILVFIAIIAINIWENTQWMN